MATQRRKRLSLTELRMARFVLELLYEHCGESAIIRALDRLSKWIDEKEAEELGA